MLSEADSSLGARVQFCPRLSTHWSPRPTPPSLSVTSMEPWHASGKGLQPGPFSAYSPFSSKSLFSKTGCQPFSAPRCS